MTWLSVMHACIWNAVRRYQLTRDLKRITARTYDMKYPDMVQ